MSEFEVPQSYETTVALRDSKGEVACEFLFMCLPVSAMHEGSRQLLNRPEELLTELLPTSDAEPRELRVAQLPDAIFTVLAAGTAEEEAGSVLEWVSSPDWLVRRREEDPAGALFAEYLAFGEVVPFEQSKLSASAAASLAMKSYKPTKEAATDLAAFAPVLGPHGAVVFLVALGAAAGAVVIVDSIGVVVGFAASNPRTAGAIRAVRRWFTRHVHRQEASASSANLQEQIEAAERELRELRAALATAEKATDKALEEEARQHAKAVARQRRMREKAPHPKISNGL